MTYPMARTRALVIVRAPQDYAPARLREAARYLLDRRDATEEERRLASEAIAWLRSKRADKVPLKTAEPSNSCHSREQQAQAPAKCHGAARSEATAD